MNIGELKATFSRHPGLLSYLQNFLSENKKKLFEKIIQHRTRHIAVVTENVFDEHNTNAVIRSCECFGIQDIYVISSHQFKTSKGVQQGSGKWVTIHKFNEPETENTESCLAALKSKKYLIAATSPYDGNINIGDLDLSHPVAICFGSEHLGVSDKIKSQADFLIRIPMAGFTESFNISVAAAVCMYAVTQRLLKSNIHWNLSAEEKQEILFDWTLKCVKKPEVLIRQFLNETRLNNRQTEPPAII